MWPTQTRQEISIGYQVEKLDSLSIYVSTHLALLVPQLLSWSSSVLKLSLIISSVRNEYSEN